MPKPSYIDGMYPLIGRPKYPSLWRGCVGAWAPCLGPSGLTLFDWSGFKRHGTLTNMDPASDWIPSGGRYSLDFDGSNDYVSVSGGFTRTLSGNNQHAVSLWVNGTSFANSPVVFCDNSTSTAVNYFLEFNATTGFYWGTSTFRTYSGLSFATGVWYHICVVKTGTGNSGDLYIDGVLQTSYTGSIGNTLTATADLQFGIYANSFVPLNGKMDDIRIYNRILSPSEVRSLARRRGISYEVAERTFDPGTNRRRRVLIGA